MGFRIDPTLQDEGQHDLLGFWSAVEELRRADRTLWHQLATEIFYGYVNKPTDDGAGVQEMANSVLSPLYICSTYSACRLYDPWIQGHPGYVANSLSPYTGWVGHLFRRFCDMFLKVPFACLGSMAAAVAVQPNGLGNSQKTVYKTFRTSGRPTQYINYARL